ncbi:MAG: DUF3368 domain-containing protein [Planctomycetes bacterium]|nr:DUF3368 domain-containing protein [Planctomycetota bacterium]
MLIVSDTSPVSALLQIGRIELLRDVFSAVCIPTAVRDELLRFHSALPEFLEVREVSDRTQVQSLLATLDLGEAEAIVLALECQADRLLVDERRCRTLATQMGIPIIGLLGVLLLARKQGIVGSIKDTILELRATGFYLDDAVVRTVLLAAGESP